MAFNGLNTTPKEKAKPMEDEYLDSYMEDMLSGGSRYDVNEPTWDDEDFPADQLKYLGEPSDEPSDAMDGDAESALRDAGFGTDEDYGYFGGDEF